MPKKPMVNFDIERRSQDKTSASDMPPNALSIPLKSSSTTTTETVAEADAEYRAETAAKIYINLAKSYSENGEDRQYLCAALLALKWAEKAKDASHLAASHALVGNFYKTGNKAQHHMQKAEELAWILAAETIKQSKTISDFSPHVCIVAEILMTCAHFHLSNNRLAFAKNACDKAVELYGILNKHISHAQCSYQSAHISFLRGNLFDSIQYSTETLENLDKLIRTDNLRSKLRSIDLITIIYWHLRIRIIALLRLGQYGMAMDSLLSLIRQLNLNGGDVGLITHSHSVQSEDVLQIGADAVNRFRSARAPSFQAAAVSTSSESTEGSVPKMALSTAGIDDVLASVHTFTVLPGSHMNLSIDLDRRMPTLRFGALCLCASFLLKIKRDQESMQIVQRLVRFLRSDKCNDRGMKQDLFDGFTAEVFLDHLRVVDSTGDNDSSRGGYPISRLTISKICEEAVSHCECHALNDKSRLVQALLHRGNLQLLNRDRKSAKKCYDKALSVASLMESSMLAADALIGVALCLQREATICENKKKKQQYLQDEKSAVHMALSYYRKSGIKGALKNVKDRFSASSPLFDFPVPNFSDNTDSSSVLFNRTISMNNGKPHLRIEVPTTPVAARSPVEPCSPGSEFSETDSDLQAFKNNNKRRLRFRVSSPTKLIRHSSRVSPSKVSRGSRSSDSGTPLSGIGHGHSLSMMQLSTSSGTGSNMNM
eukprot:TRINITY_DN307_c2_g1_i1.p1 TRINITY_DN307_c2_g1~~TRINITY_DN307_c2_g1_i1.p1  ORF type:complete len:713 (+),score=171.54 TRINITY_DN307_c2_g1_i1:1735-3873(+)